MEPPIRHFVLRRFLVARLPQCRQIRAILHGAIEGSIDENILPVEGFISTFQLKRFQRKRCH